MTTMVPRWLAALWLGALLAAGGGGGAIAAEPALPEELGGRAFSDPRAVMPMPESWRRQAITRPAGENGKAADLALALDQQIYPALLPLVRKFAADNHVTIATQEGTCGLASGALADRSADITAMCCPPADTDRMPGVRYHTIGIAAVALIVHPSNPVENLSLAEARRLFGGSVTSWADLPVSGFRAAAGEPVRVVSRLHCSLRPGHWRLLLPNADAFSPEALDVPAIVDMIQRVSQSETAIGYETLWHVNRYAEQGRVRTVRLDGHSPADTAAVAAGKYPIYRVFNISSWTEEPAKNALAERLAQYLVAHAGDIDPVYGIVPASRLRQLGWKFLDDELVGEPR
ncbi:MAG: hypothetical protein H7840_04660 [Alphaproteobacteria bacterium]